MANPWVAVKERLPEDEQDVLACWDGPSCEPGIAKLYYIAPDEAGDGGRWFDAVGPMDAPTHWMPLPLLPSEYSECNGQSR